VVKGWARMGALSGVVLSTAPHGHSRTHCNSDPDAHGDADSDIAKRGSKGHPDSSTKGNAYSNEECLPVLILFLVFHLSTFQMSTLA